MSAPPGDGYGQYPQQQYGQPEQQPQEGYDAQGIDPPPAAGGGLEHHKKKKRGYATEAYEFGTGANAAAGGQLQGGGQYGIPPSQAPAPGYGVGYGQQDAQGSPATGYPSPQQYGQPAAPQAGGYQAPDAYYPTAQASPGMPPPGVGGITQGMSQMQMGGGQPGMPPQPQQMPQASMPLNQLYPTDLLNQPFNVSELEFPPPAIILPPQVRVQHCSTAF
jgi:protein transport protein SEC24